MLEEEYDVELYDLTHRGHPGDIRFYREVCQGAGEILELGCGSGRVMLPLLREGHRVTGLDIHPGMLRALSVSLEREPPEVRQRATLRQGDMSCFSLKARFSHVLLPYNGLYTLITEEAQRACLRCVAEHLLPGGSLWLDVYLLEEDEEDNEPELGQEGEALLEEEDEEQLASLWLDERQIDIFESRRWQPALQRLDATYTYIIKEAGETKTRRYSIPQRYLTAHQLFAMLKESGFSLGQCFEDFEKTPWQADSPALILQALR